MGKLGSCQVACFRTVHETMANLTKSMLFHISPQTQKKKSINYICSSEHGDITMVTSLISREHKMHRLNVLYMAHDKCIIFAVFVSDIGLE